MKKQLLALAVLGGVVSAANAGMYDSGYMGFMGSWVEADNGRPVDDDGLGATLLFGFPGRYVTPELNFSWTRFENNVTNKDDDNYALGLDFRFNFAPDAKVNPFLILGGGGVFEDAIPKDADERFVGYANAGLGLLLPMGDLRHTAWRFEARRYATFTDDISGGDALWDTRVNFGVQFNLQADAPAKPAPAPIVPPPPPKVVDSDADGVADSIDRCPGTVPGTKVDAYGCPLPPPDSDGDGVVDASDACPDTPRGLRVDSRGCVIKAQTLVLRNINFEFNKATLTPDSRAALDGIAAGFRGQPTMEVVLEGHTDSKGTDAYNLRLSRARAASVRDYLISQGVEARRLTARGYGESRPVTDNKTDEGRAQNRRVEFKVVKQ